MERHQSKAEAAVAAWKKRYAKIPTRHAILLCCAVAELETGCGDLMNGNWGAIQRRSMTSAEKALVAQGHTVSPTDSFELLHGDSSPLHGKYQVWFWAFPPGIVFPPSGLAGDQAGAWKLYEVLLDNHPAIRSAIDDMTPYELALAMYRARYYEGFHDPTLHPGEHLDADGLTPGEAANVKEYCAAITRGYNAFNTALPNWSPQEPLADWLQRLRDPLPGETKGQHYWRAASHFVGCSLSNRFDELVALAAVCNPNPVQAAQAAHLQTNCGTFERWVIALIGDKDPYATRPDQIGMSVTWDIQIGIDAKAIVRGQEALGRLDTGWLMHFGTPGVNNDHMELCGSKPMPPLYRARHLGGGRPNNAITASSEEGDDIRWSVGRPMLEAIDPDKFDIPTGPPTQPSPPPPPPTPVPPPLPKYDLTQVAGYQGALKALGFDPGPLDGIVGLRTKAAVRAFQAAHPPLQVDGVFGPRTRAALQLALDVAEK